MADTSSRLLYSATMPLDGFIAGVGGDMSWLVIIAPVLLGDGVRLFDHSGGTRVHLDRIHERNGLTSHWYGIGAGDARGTGAT